ncbi:hypothetical protein [Streptomyces erythrochromogenes]|uniref:hypothetical protein n=1 Tax=Streptomyces erythrochromogenes TaxID=285574 RepID=UPI0036A55F4C
MTALATVPDTGWQRWEHRVQTSAQPVAYRLLRSIAARGPVVRVPRVGVVVSDAALAHDVLCDTAHFTNPDVSSDNEPRE